jgi:hypothetical protein
MRDNRLLAAALRALLRAHSDETLGRPGKHWQLQQPRSVSRICVAQRSAARPQGGDGDWKRCLYQPVPEIRSAHSRRAVPLA